MPALNRFFNPSQSKYQSQFVPKNLPIDLMAKTLYAKQAKADQMLAASIKLGDWDQAALSGHDTEYVKGIKNEIQAFADKAMTEDRTSPEFQRQYLDLTNRIKKDENIKKVQASVDNYTEHQDTIKKLKAQGDHAHADWLDAQYQYNLNEYTKEGGQGFKGEALADPNTLKGMDLWSEKTKYFKELKDSGSDVIKYLGSGIAYKQGWDGVSKSRIGEQFKNTYSDYRNSNAGKEEFTKKLYENGLVESQLKALPEGKRKEQIAEIEKQIQDDFLEAGLTYVHGKSTTNIDTAYNAQRTEDLEKEIGVVLPTGEKVFSKEATFKDRDEAIKSQQKHVDELNSKIRIAEQKIKNGVSSGYTAEGLAALKKAEASARRQVSLLKEEKNEDYQKIATTQKALVKGEYDALAAQTSKLMGTFKTAFDQGLISKDDYLFLVEAEGKNPSAGSFTGLITTSGVVADILDELPLDGKYAELKGALRSYQGLEHKKELLDGRASRLTRKVWQDNYDTPGASTSSVQMSGASVRTDKNSTMFAVNSDVVSNSEMYSFYTADGKLITMDGITKFEGNSVTSGDFRNKGQIGVNGKVTYKTPKLDSEGNVVRSNSGAGGIVYETKTTSINAVPHGAHVQFLKNNWAREQQEVARIKEAQGKFEEAAVARGHSMNLNSQSLYQDLIDFQASDTGVTTVATSAYSADGKTAGTAEFVLKKVGTVGAGGGFQVKYGSIVEELPDMNAVNTYIQRLTNSSIQQ